MSGPRQKVLDYARDTIEYILEMDARHNDINAKIDSPIEQALLEAMYVHALLHHPGYIRVLDSVEGVNLEDNKSNFCVLPQAKIGQYRVDFMVCDMASLPGFWLVVECDGHAFHEKTKEQAQHDKSRDRYIQSQGYRILRFTGSEIYRDPMKCADEINSFIIGEQYRKDAEGESDA